MQLFFRTLIFILLFTCSTTVSAVGYRLIKSNSLNISVWYPSDEKEIEVIYGPFDASFAINAEVKQGKYQPVLISHGNSGRVRNHYLTAKALAESGFIAIAPLHNADYFVGTDDTAKALYWRTKELLMALEVVMHDESLKHVLDISRVHGLGYSLGGLTIMQAAGAS